MRKGNAVERVGIAMKDGKITVRGWVTFDSFPERRPSKFKGIDVIVDSGAMQGPSSNVVLLCEVP
jgi:formylmethanofuran dehydrogenase subunit C